MKLSKSLLQAMLVGIAIGGAVSCSEGLVEDIKDLDLTPNKDRCIPLPLDVLDNGEEVKTSNDPGNCPACGMG
jgi:hypothetical protein